MSPPVRAPLGRFLGPCAASVATCPWFSVGDGGLIEDIGGWPRNVSCQSADEVTGVDVVGISRSPLTMQQKP